MIKREFGPAKEGACCIISEIIPIKITKQAEELFTQGFGQSFNPTFFIRMRRAT